MKKPMKSAMITASLLGALCAAEGKAADSVRSVADLKSGSRILLSGSVEQVQNAREFTLRDATGVIGVDLPKGDSIVLKSGDSVLVRGVVDRGLLTTDINASEVRMRKDNAQALGDAIEAHTGISFEGAVFYRISELPDEGLVKVAGLVTDVKDESEFRLSDPTGSIPVIVQPPQKAALTPGARVTVIGYMKDSLFKRDLNAYRIFVVADSARAR